MKTNPNDLSAALVGLLDSAGLAGLTPHSRPGAHPLKPLQAKVGEILRNCGLPARDQDLIRGTVLLWNDHLDAAHSLAQAIEDSDGSLLHAMMHRREPDYSNSKYWYRHAGRHAIYDQIATQVGGLLAERNPDLAAKLAAKGVWDPFKFVDACEAAESGRGDGEVLKEIQRIEFVALLKHLCGL